LTIKADALSLITLLRKTRYNRDFNHRVQPKLPLIGHYGRSALDYRMSAYVITAEELDHVAAMQSNNHYQGLQTDWWQVRNEHKSATAHET